ncbi:MAG: 4Fe-4S dicluster domain-containing protein [Planctomycetota bacterium]
MSSKQFEVKILKRYCKGCGLCVEVCDQNKIHIADRPNREGRRTATFREDVDCTGCLKCATICPDAAIEIYRLQEVEADGHDSADCDSPAGKCNE